MTRKSVTDRQTDRRTDRRRRSDPYVSPLLKQGAQKLQLLKIHESMLTNRLHTKEDNLPYFVKIVSV